MRRLLSAEELLAALEQIIVPFRMTASDNLTSAEARQIAREAAITKIRGLGFSLADAERG